MANETEIESGDLERVKAAAEKLGEHFDSVQILCTRHEPAVARGTVNINFGVGNWFTRYDQAREWLVKCDEGIRSEVRDLNGER
jgi:hypothetical protein